MQKTHGSRSTTIWRVDARAHKRYTATMRPLDEQLKAATQESEAPNRKPLAERKPVFSVDDLIRGNAAGDGFGAIVKVAADVTEHQKRTIQWWHRLGAGVKEICRITGLGPATVQNTLTELSRECGPMPAETRDALQSRLGAQLDWQRTDLQQMVADPNLPAKDRTAAHRCLLLLARTQADIAGIHRTADTELARSIEALLVAGREAGQPVAIGVAPLMQVAAEDDAADQREGERLERSQRAAERKHYRAAAKSADSPDAKPT